MNGPSSLISSSCSRPWSLLKDLDRGRSSESNPANVLPNSGKTFVASDLSAKFRSDFLLFSSELVISSWSPPMRLLVTFSAEIRVSSFNWQLLNSYSLLEQFSLVRPSSPILMMSPVEVGIGLLSNGGAFSPVSLTLTSTVCSVSCHKSRKVILA